MSVQQIVVQILVLMWSFMMVGQQVRLRWGDFVRGRLGMSLSCRKEIKCLWCSILDKQLIVDLKRSMNPQRPMVSTLWRLFWISSFITIKHFSWAKLLLTRSATDYAPTCMWFYTALFLETYWLSPLTTIILSYFRLLLKENLFNISLSRGSQWG